MKKTANITLDRSSFVFYRSFYTSIDKCPQEDQILLYRAVASYALNGEEPDFTGSRAKPFVEAIWEGFRAQLDANTTRYLNGLKGAEYGHRGGAPKGNTNARKQPQNNPKTTPNVNDNDNVNVNVKERRELQLPFKSEKFLSSWKDLRSLPGWKAKTVSSLQRTLDQLSKYDEAFALVLIDNAIEGQYKRVVYDDTQAKYELWKKTRRSTPREKVITSIEDLKGFGQ